jgi:hypothetical protein
MDGVIDFTSNNEPRSAITPGTGLAGMVAERPSSIVPRPAGEAAGAAAYTNSDSMAHFATSMSML